MAALGADVHDLDALATRLRSVAGQLERVHVSTSGAVRTVCWMGPDAAEFRSRWTTAMGPGLRAVADAVRAQADGVAVQARQQRAASGDAGGGFDLGIIGDCTPMPPDLVPRFPRPADLPLPPHVPPRLPRPPDLPPGWPGEPGDVDVPPLGPPADPLPPDRVVRSEVVRASGTLGIGPAVLHAEGTYRIEHLANGTVRVTELLGGSRGVSVDAGLRADIDAGRHELRSGVMGDVQAMAGLRLGRTWEVPPDEVERLIVGANLERQDPTGQLRRLASAGSSAADDLFPDRLGPINLPYDEVSEAARHYLDYRMPPPVRQGLDVTGSAGVSGIFGHANTASMNGEGGVTIEVGGFREADGDLGIRYQVGASGAGSAHAPVLSIPGLVDPPSGGGQASLGAEVVYGPDGQTPKRLVLEHVVGSGDRPTMARTVVDIVTPQQRADIQIMRDAFANPTPANLERLQQIDPAHWEPYTQRVEAGLTVDAEDYGAGAGAGAIPGLVEGSADLRLERSTTTYDYGR